MNNDPKILREARRLAKTQSRASGQPYSKHLDEIARQAGHGTWSSYVRAQRSGRSEEHTSELQSLMRISYAVFCLKKKNKNKNSKTTYMNKQEIESDRKDNNHNT